MMKMDSMLGARGIIQSAQRDIRWIKHTSS